MVHAARGKRGEERRTKEHGSTRTANAAEKVEQAGMRRRAAAAEKKKDEKNHEHEMRSIKRTGGKEKEKANMCT